MNVFKALGPIALFALVSCTTTPISIEPIVKRPKAKLNYCDRKPVIIAVIDTGFGWKGLGADATLCNYGHKDFTAQQKFIEDAGTVTPVPLDEHGHGTNIVGLIDRELKEANFPYCVVVLKYYLESQTGDENAKYSTEAIQYAKKIGVDYINYSGGGILKVEAETQAIVQFLDKGGHFIAAAGNEGLNIDYFGFYPAKSDERIIVVGAYDKEGTKARTSNYGNRVNRWELGVNVEAYGYQMTGTSQATAIATGKIVFENEKSCDRNKEIEKIAHKSQ